MLKGGKGKARGSAGRVGSNISVPTMSRSETRPKMPLSAGSIKIGYWNIHGWSSRMIGNKLVDPEFLEKISSCDIVALSELHSDKELSLPGFVSKKQKIRKKIHKGPKIAGGIGIFVKEEFKDLAQLVSNENQDSIWIKIRKELCNEPEDIFIGSFYISPDGKQGTNTIDFFTSMNKELNIFRQKGIVLVQGDLNARTGVENDFVNFDKSDELLGIDNLSNHCLRNSEDEKLNPRGKELLDLCKVNDLLIANGRKPGDLFGKFTSHQYNGSALNDYLLAPNSFLEKISHFSVGDFAPWLSDHCPILSTVKLNTLTKQSISAGKPRETEPNFIFDATSKQVFCEGLRSAETSQYIQKLLEDDNLSVLNMGAATKTLLLNNAKNCGIRLKKTKIDVSNCAPWFDSECTKTKK